MSLLFRSRTYCSVLGFSRRARERHRDQLLSVKSCGNLPVARCLFFSANRHVSRDERLSVANPAIRKYLDHIIKKYDKVKAGHSNLGRNSELSPLVDLLESRLTITENISSLEELGKDKEIKELVEEESSVYKMRLTQVDEELVSTILSNMARDDHRDVILEITAGVGGQEAMLFARDLYGMYLGYMDYLGYECELLDHGVADAGGTRHASLSVSGDGAFMMLRHEAGVHRVQRIPATERSGRVHTSTVTVAVLPQPTDIEVSLADKDLKIETKRASGAGGQHVNTTDSAVRIVHLPTGLAVESQSQRSQMQNKAVALRTLRARIYAMQLAEQETSTRELRKSQRGLGLRNEKIRTYNYQQNRVTDHRLPSGTVHNLKGFLEGGEALCNLAKMLEQETSKAIFLETVNEVGKN